jgi:3-oxoacyl-[acyl-carrier protein] reductase
MAKFEDRAALVTGATKENGIGWATAQALAAEGAFVAVTASTRDGADELDDRLHDVGMNGVALELSFTNLMGFESLKHKCEDRLGVIEAEAGMVVSLLVNNAGITHDGLAMKMTEADWDEVHAVKNTGPFFLTMAAVAAMRATRPRVSGNVVNVSSVVGLHGHAGQANYAAANAAMIGWTKTLAEEYAGKGLSINAIAPGLVDTDLTTGRLTEQQLQALVDMTPLGRAQQPSEIADKIVEMLEDDEMNGQVVIEDGGLTEALTASKE